MADDDTLLGWARAGDSEAFGELYQRHAHAAHDYARRLSLRHLRRDAADDILAEAIRKILDAIAHGVGPVLGFRRYLFISVRSVAYTQSRLPRAAPLDAFDEVGVDPTDRRLDVMVALDALHDLPRRWQQVLWATAVLGYQPSDLAPTAGLTNNNVAVLSRRARDGLRVAYERRHLPVATTSLEIVPSGAPIARSERHPGEISPPPPRGAGAGGERRGGRSHRAA